MRRVFFSETASEIGDGSFSGDFDQQISVA
jgi:hypothetical protein